MISDNGSQWSALPVLFGRSVRLFLQMAPALIGMSGLLAGVTVLTAWLLLGPVAGPLAALTGLTIDRLIPYASLIPLALTHTIYSLWACRLFARALAPGFVKTLSPAAWGASVLVLTCGIVAVAAILVATIPAAGSMTVIVIIAALLTCTPILPALTLRGPSPSAFRFCFTTALVAMPWLSTTEILGWPAQECVGECWGLFEGGIIMWPIFAVHMFLAATTAALVSTLVHVTLSPQPTASSVS